MKVESIMTRDVAACTAGQTLNCAAQIMWDRDCGCVPVVDGNNLVVGMLTDRDICMAAYTTNAPLTALRVGDIMCKQVIACGPFDSIEQAEALMQRHKIRRLPVVGFENQLMGILSLNDLARAARVQPHTRERGINSDAIEVTLAAVSEPRSHHVVAAT
ncbi:MAG TPA: CBS domain-containing protein [Polyangia bacterium]